MARMNKGIAQYGPLFEEHASLPAIDAGISVTERQIAGLNRQLGILTRLRELRVQQIADGTWPNTNPKETP